MIAAQNALVMPISTAERWASAPPSPLTASGEGPFGFPLTFNLAK